MKKTLLVVGRVLLYFMMAALVVLGAAIIWLMNTWVNLSYGEIIFHVKSSIEGTNPEMVYQALIKYGIPALLIVLAVTIGNEIIRKKSKKISRIVMAIVLVIAIVFDSVIIYVFNEKTEIASDFANSLLKTNASTFVEENYVDAGTVEMTFPEEKRNLIYIYLESMESTYADETNGGAFPKNVIPELTTIGNENENFSGDNETLDGAITLPGTDWTMGGMFAQSTGLPLKIALDGNSFQNEGVGSFFPGVTTIGDVLAIAGYKNTLLVGSDAHFAGRKLFYVSHGNYDIHDYYYAINQGLIPEDYYEFWGYEDEKLFEFAKQDLLELAASDQPFNYTMLTVDTHFEDGYVCDLCQNEFGDNQYANVFACSDRQVSEFIEWIKEQDFYENTTIVLCGDHITMDSDFCENVPDDYQRKTYTCIINSAAEKQLDDYREYATIDMYPTTLAALGVEMSSDRLGVGTNLYSNTQTIIEEYGLETIQDEFSRSSEFLENMSSLSIDESALNNVRDNIELEPTDVDGTLTYKVTGASAVDINAVDNIWVNIKNGDTNKQYKYYAELIHNENDPGWYGLIRTDIEYEDLDYLTGEIYISVGDYEDYFLKEITPDMYSE